MDVRLATTRKQAILMLALLSVFFLAQHVLAEGIDPSAAVTEINKVGLMIINLCQGPIVKGLMILFFIIAGVNLGHQRYAVAGGWGLAGLMCAFAPGIATAIFKK